MFNYLQSQRVNLQLLQESACRELADLLESIDGKKLLILEESILGSLGLIASPAFFSDRDIKLMKLNAESPQLRGITNVIYVVRPQVSVMDTVAAHVKNNMGNNTLFHIFFVPRRSCICIKHLENLKLSDSFGKIGELSWNFFPMDADVLSMEIPSAFYDVVEGDPTVLYQAAVGLVQLQRISGRIPKIYGKGSQSLRVWEHAKQLGAEESLMNGDRGMIDQLILLDRSIDILSILATQLTYEGLIDEFYGIRNNKLLLPSELFASRAEDGVNTSQSNLVSEKKTIFLNSSDKLYAELRNKNFNEVGKILSRHARDISAQMSANGQDKSVQDMKRFVDKLPGLLAQKQSVAVHTTIAELVRKRLDFYEFTEDLAVEQDFMMCEDIDKPSSYIEDMIARKDDLRNVLRLMCLQCAAASGFKEKVLNYYKRELVQVYGLEVLLKISNLEKAGLLYTQNDARAYAVLRKTLNLTVDDVVEIEPKDISYVHSFYAPLSTRIVEQTLKPLGWQSLKSQITNLPGPTFEDFQAQLIGIGGRQSSATPGEGSSLNIPRLILVFFVGGCTFAEISALRFLSQQEDNNVQFIIATSKIVNKHNFMDSLM